MQPANTVACTQRFPQALTLSLLYKQAVAIADWQNAYIEVYACLLLPISQTVLWIMVHQCCRNSIRLSFTILERARNRTLLKVIIIQAWLQFDTSGGVTAISCNVSYDKSNW
jgi:hypothetical protein